MKDVGVSKMKVQNLSDDKDPEIEAYDSKDKIYYLKADDIVLLS